MSASIDAYRSVSLGTESPRHVILKLYGAGVRFLEQAEEDLAAGRPGQESLSKARLILGGLMTSLDFEAGELPKRLLQLYLFVLGCIQSSVADGKDRGLAEARRVLEVLRSAWEEMPAEEAARESVLAARRSSGFDLQG